MFYVYLILIFGIDNVFFLHLCFTPTLTIYSIILKKALFIDQAHITQCKLNAN
jgi:hypothetical protein